MGDGFQMPFFRSTDILRLFLTLAMRMPKLTGALALLALVALAGTITYTGFLVVGMLAEYLGTGRFVTGLLLGLVFARFPKFSKGKFRTVGLLPQPARRPVMLGLLALCLVSFVARGDYVPAAFTGFVAAFVLTFPLIRRAVVSRVTSSIFKFASGRGPSDKLGGTVIDGEFREKKD